MKIRESNGVHSVEDPPSDGGGIDGLDIPDFPDREPTDEELREIEEDEAFLALNEAGALA